MLGYKGWDTLFFLGAVMAPTFCYLVGHGLYQPPCFCALCALAYGPMLALGSKDQMGQAFGGGSFGHSFYRSPGNLGLVPSASNSIPLYDGIFTYLAPLGIFYLFLAVIGAYCEIGAVLGLEQVGLTLLAFTSVAVLLHGVVIIALGGLFFRDWEMVAIASQVNVGGGASAIALAETFDRNELILPAIMVGTLGNALGTYLGFFVVSVL